MRTRDALGIALTAALGLGVAAYGARVAGAYRGTRLELGRVKLSHVDEATRERLASLDENLLVTYYVSPRSEMPSELKRLERQVTDLFEALREASDGRLQLQILDPHEDPEQPNETGDRVYGGDNARYAARQGIAPFRVRSIAHDVWSERTIWSSLSIAYGAHPPAIVNGVSPENLPRLTATLLAHIEQMERPRRPVVALAAPPAGFERLRGELEKTARVVDVDPADGELPREADVLFWMDPGGVDAALLRELDAFLDSGRSAVIAGSLLRVAVGGREAEGEFVPEAFEVSPSGFDASTLWSHFGLRPTEGLVCDGRFPVVYREGEGEAAEETPIPFLVRCIAPNQRFGLAFASQPNGTLFFDAPTPLALDPDELADRGWLPSVLAHTSDATWIEPVPRGPADATVLRPERGVAVSRQPLVTLLEPVDPWRGSVVAMGSAGALRDDLIHAEGFAHRRLVDVLVKNLASDARLVMHHADVVVPEPVPPLSAGERALWRTVCVFLVPAVLGVVALARGALRAGRVGTRIGRLGGAAGRRRVVLPTAALVLLALAAARASDALRWRADLTRAGLNSLAPATRELAGRASGDGALRAELFVSRDAKLPPAMRAAVPRVRDLLGDLDRAGADVRVTTVHPDDESDAVREALAAEGIEPVRRVTEEDGQTLVRTVYSTLRLSARGRSELLRLPDAAAFEDLELRVAFALRRLETGRTPHVAFASDAPRLSPAEAHMDYQQKGLFAPVGDDPYSLARRRLADVGFRVTHVNPRDPELPRDFDVLVWLQPRRDATVMIDAMARLLHQGARVLLAAQHFNMQARQYRGTNFKTVYWPQPQTPDIDLYWFPELGIELVREVLFDELRTRRQMETQVNRNASRRDYERQASALPFLIRASAANFADDPITTGIGDQSFAWGNRLRWDEARLAELGLEAEPLIRTSERTWSFGWKGGYLPDEVYRGLPEADSVAGEGTSAAEVTVLGPQPLAARFRGTFPLPVEPIVREPEPDPETGAAPSRRLELPDRPPAPGELVLVGGSELFKNANLMDPEFRADQLLVNAVVDLALEPELAAVATRRRVPRGLDWIDAATKRTWRAVVLAAGPVALVAFGLLRELWRRRAPRVRVSARAGGARA